MNKVITGVVLACLILVIGFLFGQRPVNLTYSGVARAQEYQSTTTSNTWNTPAAIVGGSKILSCSNGALGSIIIHDATAGVFTIYDGTTTGSHNLYPTTTLAKVTASQTEGTYTYDSVANFGVLVEFQSPNVASSTITFRGNPVCQ